MTSLAPLQSSFTVLDQLILAALADLRAARTVAAKAGNRRNLEQYARAEEHLNALLEYRHAAQGR